MFLWKGSADKISWTPVSQNTVTKAVVDGGLGIRDITRQNSAAMAHLVWCFLKDQDDWWTRLLRQKYLDNTSFELCQPRASDSPLWKAMLKVKDIIIDNQHWVIGNGTQVQALDDEWVPGVGRLRQHLLPRQPLPNQESTTTLQLGIDATTVMMVEELTTTSQSRKIWNEPLLRDMWPQKVVRKFMEILLCQRDIRCWLNEPAGRCSYRALFRYLQTGCIGPTFLWKEVWKIEVLPKIRFFAWQALLNKLPTRARLARWDPSISPLCPLCNLADETIDHLLIQCPFAKNLWLGLPESIPRPASSLSPSHTGSS